MKRLGLQKRSKGVRQPLITGVRVAAGLVVLACSASAVAGNLYRWTDGQGQRHMESTIPADQAKFGYEVVDDRTFRVIKKVGRQLTDEELAAAAREAEAEAEKQRLQEAKERHDRTLLATYVSVDDMEMARNGQFNTLDLIIESTERTMERLQANLDDLIASAAGYERDGRKVPPRTEKSIETVKGQIERQREIIAENELKKSQIAEQFATDIARFRELKGIVEPVSAKGTGHQGAMPGDRSDDESGDESGRGAESLSQ